MVKVIVVSTILIALLILIFFLHSTNFSTPSQKSSSFMEHTLSTETAPISVNSSKNGAPKGKCDLFIGKWIPNPSGPIYSTDSCDIIQGHINCMRNGRPDSGYLNWKWSPRDCELPRFNGGRFLELMRNKSWAFVGDSIASNHVQSLVCILSKVEKAVEVYHDETYQWKRWKFPSYNFTVSVFWSPFLIKNVVLEDTYDDIGQLHLDKMDEKWTDQYHNFDYVIISGGGKRFLKSAVYYENDTITGYHNCPDKKYLRELGFENAYRKALQQVFNFITTSSKDKPVLTLFRTTTPDHFEKGDWSSGGSCRRKEPFIEGEMNITSSYIDSMLHNVELEEFKKAEEVASRNGLGLKLMDTTGLSLLRPDGHPGPYMSFQPFADGKLRAIVQNDCLHWCLPGPIDSWNDLLMEIVVNG